MPPTPYTNQFQIKQALLSMGRNVDLRTIGKTHRIYSGLQADMPKEGVEVVRNVPYGAHARHRLDVYVPQPRGVRAHPILVFIHGGGFVQGDKCREENIGYYFARQGFMTIVANYRLAPAYRWPSGVEDMAAIVEWIQSDAHRWSGDSNVVFLMGHSAGATHVATFLFIERVRSKQMDGVTGAILLSGPAYDTRRLNPQKDTVYFGHDPSSYPAMSVMEHIGGFSGPVFIVYAELDPTDVTYQSMALYRVLRDRNSAVQLKQLKDHNHISEIMHIGSEDESLGPDIVKFIQTMKIPVPLLRESIYPGSCMID